CGPPRARGKVRSACGRTSDAARRARLDLSGSEPRRGEGRAQMSSRSDKNPLVGNEGGIAGRRRGGVRHSAALPEAAPNARLVRASEGASERAPPNRAATRERTTVRAPRRDVGPRSVNSAVGEPPPRLAVVMAVPLTLGRGHEARAN